MNLLALKKNLTRSLLFALPFLLLFGAAAPSADARDHHRRGRGRRHAYRQHHYRGGGHYRQHRRHRGYWRRYHGRRYWYENGGYYSSPGGVSISIGL